MSFRKEIERRNIYKAGIACAIFIWILIQALATILPARHPLSWTFTFIFDLTLWQAPAGCTANLPEVLQIKGHE